MLRLENYWHHGINLRHCKYTDEHLILKIRLKDQA